MDARWIRRSRPYSNTALPQLNTLRVRHPTDVRTAGRMTFFASPLPLNTAAAETDMNGFVGQFLSSRQSKIPSCDGDQITDVSAQSVRFGSEKAIN